MTTRAAPVSRVIPTATPETAPRPAAPQPELATHRLQRALGNQDVGRLIQRYSSGST